VVEIWEGVQSIKIINFYNPCDRLSKDKLENIGGNGSHKVVWCGDFNAHSTLWRSTNTDYSGLMETLVRLVCINDGRFTRVDLSQGKYSMLDLTLVSESLAGKCDWKVLNQSTVGSDHFPISSTIGLDIVQIVAEKIAKVEI